MPQLSNNALAKLRPEDLGEKDLALGDEGEGGDSLTTQHFVFRLASNRERIFEQSEVGLLPTKELLDLLIGGEEKASASELQKSEPL